MSNTRECLCGAGKKDEHFGTGILSHDRFCPWPCYADFNQKWADEWQRRAEQAEIAAEVASFENEINSTY